MFPLKLIEMLVTLRCSSHFGGCEVALDLFRFSFTRDSKCADILNAHRAANRRNVLEVVVNVGEIEFNHQAHAERDAHANI